LTNADYLTEFAESVGKTMGKNVQSEHILVGPGFTRFDYALEKRPDLMIIHLSSFFGSTNKTIDPAEFTESMVEFQTFMQYMLDNVKKLHVLVYTRDIPEKGVWTASTHKLVIDNLARQKQFISDRKPRMSLVVVPWDAKFSNPKVSLDMHQAIRTALEDLPG